MEPRGIPGIPALTGCLGIETLEFPSARHLMALSTPYATPLKIDDVTTFPFFSGPIGWPGA